MSDEKHIYNCISELLLSLSDFGIQIDRDAFIKKKLFLPRYLVDKAGGADRIERTFDYQCEVVIIPDACETVA